MRATILTVALVFATCLLRSSEAVTCTADATVTGCIDCTTNPTDAECVAEAAAEDTTSTTTTTTTVAPDTASSTTVASTTVSSASSGSSSSSTGKRKIVRISNLTYSNTRRVRVYKNNSRSNQNRRNNANRNNNRNRSNRNVRVIIG
ncbi:cell wall integrity and stress response component 3 [Drosophila ficusphila]|uniref:cell wall integrity and stress response component 3 n=1 Tax=Drosophila ficusphila TaxID=30025 RepID=UPI0007E6CEE2|nr:cell wall integrity and stress response component 3 [Drosophila ficusphila]